MKHIVIFASGGGSNAEVIINHFKNSTEVKVVAVVCNNKNAGVIEKAHGNDVPVITINKNDLTGSNLALKLKALRTDLIVLAGFLWLIPAHLIQEFAIINIHPSLLPKHGGKGMYGLNVHKAVLAANDTESGMTVHKVSEEYDRGEIILQATCDVLPTDTPETLAQRVLTLEHENYVKAIEKVLF